MAEILFTFLEGYRSVTIQPRDYHQTKTGKRYDRNLAEGQQPVGLDAESQ
jgi:hypothetical protein